MAINNMKSSVKPVTSWSYSRYSDYKQCPLKFRLKHIDKISEPKNQAMERGSSIHTMAENFIKGKIKKLPVELQHFKVEFLKLKGQYKKKISGVIVEDNWSFTSNWTKTQWNDWVNCWVRIKLDCAHYEDGSTLVVTDWKTGKFNLSYGASDYVEQLELYALAALLLHDHIETVKPRLVYLDHGKIYPGGGQEEELTFTRADIPRLKTNWAKRVKPMMNDKIFAPKPNNMCKWCHFRASNKDNGGGQCKF